MESSEDWIGEGVVQMVDIFSCVVLVNSETQCVPKTRLRRKIVAGMMVEVLPGAVGIVRAWQSSGESSEHSPHAFDGRMGFVTGLDKGVGIATVVINGDISVCVMISFLIRLLNFPKVRCHVNSLRETQARAIPTITQDIVRKIDAPLPTSNADSINRNETYTGASPWIGIAVIILEPNNNRRGQFASVQAVRKNDKMRSGLEVYVRYETISAQQTFEWVDYHWVRHRECILNPPIFFFKLIIIVDHLSFSMTMALTPTRKAFGLLKTGIHRNTPLPSSVFNIDSTSMHNGMR
jgi:hypothetical protein